MPAKNSAAVRSPERELVITRIFDAPRNLVFSAWSEPERMVHWLGPKGFTGTILKMDARPGGTYRFHMRSPEGTDHWVQGTHHEIVAPERLVYTWAWADAQGRPTGPETLITVTFAEHDGKTRLTLHQAVFESVNARDMHRTGWTSSLDRLAEYLATL